MAGGFVNLDLKTGYGKGKYADLRMNVKLMFEPNDNFAQGKFNAGMKEPPQLEVYGETDGGVTRLGSCWLFRQTRGEAAGKPVLAFVLDDPTLPDALWLSAYQRGKDGEFAIVWERRRRDEAV